MNKYIIFNKPYGVLSQFTSQDEQRTLAEFNLPKEVYAAGRLDKDSEGLLLLTNDGPFIKQFLDRHERIYLAQVEGKITDVEIKKLKKPLKLKDGLTKPCKVRIVNPPIDIPDRDPPIRNRKTIPTSWIELTLTEGRNRQVRRMTAHIGFPTLRLIRIGLGKLSYKDLGLFTPGKYYKIKKSFI